MAARAATSRPSSPPGDSTPSPTAAPKPQSRRSSKHHAPSLSYAHSAPTIATRAGRYSDASPRTPRSSWCLSQRISLTGGSSDGGSQAAYSKTAVGCPRTRLNLFAGKSRTRALKVAPALKVAWCSGGSDGHRRPQRSLHALRCIYCILSSIVVIIIILSAVYLHPEG